MPQSVPRRWRRAFLRALAATANVCLSQRDAGVGRSKLYKSRRASPCFARAWDAAIAEAEAALRAAGAPLPKMPGGGAVDPSGETVLTGSFAAGNLRLWQARPNSFTIARQRDFLDALRATCNVRLAAARAKVRTATAYHRRRECADFRDAWNGAIAEGRVHLEIALIGSALHLLGGAEEGGPADDAAHAAGAQMATPEITGMDARVAVTLLKLHEPGRAGARRNNHALTIAAPEFARERVLKGAASLRAARGQGDD